MKTRNSHNIKTEPLILVLLTLLAANLTWLPEARCADNQALENGRAEQQQPSIAAAQNTMPATNQTGEADSPIAATSIDFIMDTSAISAPPTEPAAPLVPDLTFENIASPPLSPVAAPRPPKDAAEVALLVSEKCADAPGGDGTMTCRRNYSNGHYAKILTERSSEGDEAKEQVIIEEFAQDGSLLYRKTIRHRIDYNYLNDRKSKEQEFFDIVVQPTGKKTTRELMVYQYFLDTGKLRSMAWTQYKQIGFEAKAGLVYHASLRYGEDGSPERAIAERWEDGKKAASYMNWSRISRGFADLDPMAWEQWENWIRNVALQAYLP